ncbi:uncharacterized protein LOC124160778 isoform X1 [Ischnura elegans]|uniref:uncharacterized protein LOC124160778 isoform X1 n=1 Tax=Ischnura elegans TaxID=197161 RepID=UPI001ED8911B|nr:uncharacterized protein LOC124160778 isoform X1 [Ischnura elegans]
MMPDIGRWELEDFLLSMAKEFGSMEELFKKRDDFHGKVKKGYLAGVTDTLSGKDVPSGPRYWIDRDGISALYVALIQGKEEVFALLKSRNFEFLDQEKRRAEIILKGKRLRAIDISVSKKYQLITKLLLERGTMMPDIDRWELEDFLLSMADELGSIEDLFKKRDDFHEKVKKGDLAGVTEALSGKDFPSGHRYWIDRNGNSALYVVLCEGKNEVFALLKSRNFDFLNSEKRKAEIILKGRHRDLNSVLGRQFEALKSRHLLQMESITLMRKGEEDREMSISPQAIYEAADEVPEARLLMRCLQYDPDLEVIFDLHRKDINCFCSRSTAGVPGMFDPDLN